MGWSGAGQFQSCFEGIVCPEPEGIEAGIVGTPVFMGGEVGVPVIGTPVGVFSTSQTSTRAGFCQFMQPVNPVAGTGWEVTRKFHPQHLAEVGFPLGVIDFLAGKELVLFQLRYLRWSLALLRH